MSCEKMKVQTKEERSLLQNQNNFFLEKLSNNNWADMRQLIIALCNIWIWKSYSWILSYSHVFACIYSIISLGTSTWSGRPPSTEPLLQGDGHRSQQRVTPLRAHQLHTHRQANTRCTQTCASCTHWSCWRSRPRESRRTEAQRHDAGRQTERVPPARVEEVVRREEQRAVQRRSSRLRRTEQHRLVAALCEQGVHRLRDPLRRRDEGLELRVRRRAHSLIQHDRIVYILIKVGLFS